MSDLNAAQNRVVWFDIPVADLERAAAFYRGVLGITVHIEKTPGFSFGVLQHDEGNGGCLVPKPGEISGDGGLLVYLNANGRLREARAAGRGAWRQGRRAGACARTARLSRDRHRQRRQPRGAARRDGRVGSRAQSRRSARHPRCPATRQACAGRAAMRSSPTTAIAAATRGTSMAVLRLPGRRHRIRCRCRIPMRQRWTRRKHSSPRSRVATCCSSCRSRRSTATASTITSTTPRVFSRRTPPG